MLPIQTVLHYRAVDYTTAIYYPAKSRSAAQIALFAAVMYYHI